MASFKSSMSSEIKAIRDVYDLNEGKGLSAWFGKIVLDMSEEDAVAGIRYDGGNDHDIDLLYVSDSRNCIYIVASRSNRKLEYSPNKGEVASLTNATHWLADGETLRREGRTDLAEASDEYLSARKRGYGVQLIYVYQGPNSKFATDEAAIYNRMNSEEGLHCQVYGMEKLEEAWRAYNEMSETRLPEDRIRVSSGRWLRHSQSTWGSLVAVVSGQELKRLHEKYEDQLFARNIRNFLGTRTNVNSGLKSTLENPAEVENFWIYNNGVTFICDSFELKRQYIYVTGFSIVNGCQTTVSLANATREEAASSTVLVKFIKADENLVDSVIYSTNNQNPVDTWDLQAQNKTQRRLYKDLGAAARPFYYDLRPGGWKNLSPAEQRAFKDGSKSRIIKHHLCAQYIAAMQGLPAVAYKEKGKIYSEHIAQILPEDVSAARVLLAWQTGECAAHEVKAQVADAVKSDDKFKAEVLKKGGVMYVTATMAQIMMKRNGAMVIDRMTLDNACSRKTQDKLGNYAKLGCLWYVQAMRQVLDSETGEIASATRTGNRYADVRAAVDTQWGTQNLVEGWADSALPTIGGGQTG